MSVLRQLTIEDCRAVYQRTPPRVWLKDQPKKEQRRAILSVVRKTANEIVLDTMKRLADMTPNPDRASFRRRVGLPMGESSHLYNKFDAPWPLVRTALLRYFRKQPGMSFYPAPASEQLGANIQSNETFYLELQLTPSCDEESFSGSD